MPRLTRDDNRAIEIAVGRRIVMRRQILKFSQKLIAERLNISFQQLQKYENGTNRISASRLFALSILLSVPITYFFEDLFAAPGTEAEASDRINRAEQELEMTRRGAKLLSAFSRIPSKKTQKRIADLVGELASIDK